MLCKALLFFAADSYETVVTGTRNERLLKDSPVATEVIRRDDLVKTGSENLATALEDHAGLDVTRSFAGAGLRIQGLDPSYVLILVDGERITGRVNGVIDLSRFMLDDIERVEIIRGPASALYGSDALGGVINIITRRSKKALEGDLHARYGSANFADANAKIAGRPDAQTSLRLNGGYHHADPIDRDRRDVATTLPGLHQGDVFGRASFQQGARTWTLRSDYVYRDAFGVELGAGGAVFDRKNLTQTTSSSATLQWALGPGELRLMLGYSLFHDRLHLDQRRADVLDQRQVNVQHLPQAQAFYAAQLGAHTLAVGDDLFFEYGIADRLLTGQSRLRNGFYVQDEWRIKERVVTLLPGARLDTDTQFGTQATPKIALRIDPAPGFVLRIGYGWGFRAPSFQELYLSFVNSGVGYMVAGNPALKPETSQSLNLTLTYERAAVSAQVNAYLNDLRQLITNVVSQSTGELVRYTYGNVASARTAGVESQVSVRPLQGLKLDLAYTFLDARATPDERYLDGRAPHRINFGAGYFFAKWKSGANLRGTWVSARPFNTDAGVEWASPYLSLDARVEQAVGSHLRVFLGVDNILEAGDARFTPLAPRIFYGGVDARI